MFMTNRNVEQTLDASSTSTQFSDEYERATTAQVGDDQPRRQRPCSSGARNVSHRVSPALLPDGHVALHRVAAHGRGQRRPPAHDEHRHDGHARGVRRRARPATPAPTATSRRATSQTTRSPIRTAAARRSPNYQMVAIATSRDRTLQAGKLFLINLNGSEANSTAHDLTPLVPGDRSPSRAGRRPLLRRRAGGQRRPPGSS